MSSKKQCPKESAGGTPAPSLECSVCGRCFSRPSHHDRHFRTHLPPENRLSLPCSRCSKTFGRRDVLLRHLRTAHGVDPGPQPKAAQKSCHRCVQLRRKCDRGQPCRPCAAGGAVCQYPVQAAGDSTPGPKVKHSPDSGMPMLEQYPHAQAQAQARSQSQSQPQAQALPHDEQSQQPPLHTQTHNGTSMMLGYTTPESAASQNRTPPVVLHDDASSQHPPFHNGQPGIYASQPPPSQPHHQIHLNTYHHEYPRSEYDTAMTVDTLNIPGSASQPSVDQGRGMYLGHDPIGHGVPSVASASVQSMQSTAGRLSPSFSDECYMQDSLTFASSLSAVGQLDFRGTGLDWLAFDVVDIGDRYHPAESAVLPDMEPVVPENQTPLQVPRQHMAHPPPPPPPAPPVPLPSQSHQPHPAPAQYASQPPPHQHPLYSAAPLPLPLTPHGLPNNSAQHASSGEQPLHARHSSNSSSQVPPHDPAGVPSHLSPQNAHATSGQHAILPWPFESEAEAEAEAGPPDHQPPRYSLPPLREVLQNHLSMSRHPAPSDKSVLANLVVLMSDTRMHQAAHHDDPRSSATPGHASSSTSSMPLSAPPDPGMAHAASLLQRLMDTYIAKFQPILPLLHVPTWDLATAPRVLVAAMACVGSLLADDDRSHALTLSISDICMPIIAWLGSSDSANYRDISYLSALCVHQIYSLGSGNRQLYQNADRSRGILVGGLRGMGCLTTRLSLEDQADQAAQASIPGGTAQHSQHSGSVTSPPTPTVVQLPPTPSTPTSVHEQWMAWMYREREKRTAWSSFEYDCSLCTLTGRRGAVDLSELPSRLPCAETLWDAATAAAWSALYTRLHPDAHGALVSVVLRGALWDDSGDAGSENGSLLSLYSSMTTGTTTGTSTGTPNPQAKSQGVSFWSKRLCAQVIGRLLWDLKQLETLASAEYFGMPSLSSVQAPNKVRLLRGLDNLLISMDQPTTVADLISFNITSLIGHYSHLYTAQDVLDIILYIVRNTVAHGAHRLRHHKGIQMAKRRLVATLSHDPQEARRLVYHAAQIVAVANDYLVSAPCEILRIFMGYTFLIAYAAYCPNGNRFPLPETPGSGPSVVQLDVPSHRIASTADVDNWITHGGPAAIGSAPNLFAEGSSQAINGDAQALMQRLKCWGLAEKFTKILQNFEASAIAELSAAQSKDTAGVAVV